MHVRVKSCDTYKVCLKGGVIKVFRIFWNMAAGYFQGRRHKTIQYTWPLWTCVCSGQFASLPSLCGALPVTDQSWSRRQGSSRAIKDNWFHWQEPCMASRRGKHKEPRTFNTSPCWQLPAYMAIWRALAPLDSSPVQGELAKQACLNVEKKDELMNL